MHACNNHSSFLSKVEITEIKFYNIEPWVDIHKTSYNQSIIKMPYCEKIIRF